MSIIKFKYSLPKIYNRGIQVEKIKLSEGKKESIELQGRVLEHLKKNGEMSAYDLTKAIFSWKKLDKDKRVMYARVVAACKALENKGKILTIRKTLGNAPIERRLYKVVI